jgi:hypothetical protein
MAKSMFFSALSVLCLTATEAYAERICPLNAIGAGAFVPLLSCPRDRCPQLMPLAGNQQVSVVNADNEWSELTARNDNGQLIRGFARSQFVCP